MKISTAVGILLALTVVPVYAGQKGKSATHAPKTTQAAGPSAKAHAPKMTGASAKVVTAHPAKTVTTTTSAKPTKTAKTVKAETKLAKSATKVETEYGEIQEDEQHHHGIVDRHRHRASTAHDDDD